MNSKLVLATAALAAIAVTSTEARSMVNPFKVFEEETKEVSATQKKAEHKSRILDWVRSRDNRRFKEQLKHLKPINIAQFTKHPLISRHLTKQDKTKIALLDEDEEQGGVADVVGKIISNVIVDWLRDLNKGKRWEEEQEDFDMSLFDEDEDFEQGGGGDFVYKIIQGVLVPIGTDWVEGRIKDFNKWARSLQKHEDEEAVVLLEEYITELSLGATQHVLSETGLLSLLDEEQEDNELQVLPAVLVWIGGVLYQVVEGYVVGWVIDKSVATVKKLAKGHKLWEEELDYDEEEEEQLIYSTLPVRHRLSAFDEVGSLDFFDEESASRFTTHHGHNSTHHGHHGRNSTVPHHWAHNSTHVPHHPHHKNSTFVPHSAGAKNVTDLLRKVRVQKAQLHSWDYKNFQKKKFE